MDSVDLVVSREIPGERDAYLHALCTRTGHDKAVADLGPAGAPKMPSLLTLTPSTGGASDAWLLIVAKPAPPDG